MFTIEQSGSITKSNTIDDIINEYIKQCVNKYVIINCGGNNNGSLNESEVKNTIKESLEKELSKYITKDELDIKINTAINDAVNGIQIPVIPDDLVTSESLESTLSEYALKADIKELPTDLVNNESLESTLSEYALKADIKELPTDLVTSESLESTLSEYALKSDIKEIPTDLVSESTLANTLKDYYTIGQIEEKFVDEDELAYELNNFARKTDIKELPTDLVNNETLESTLSEYALKTDIKELPADLVNETSLTNTLSEYRTINNIIYKISEKCEFKSDGIVLTTESLDGYHIVGYCELLNIHFDKVFKAEMIGVNQGYDFKLMFLENDSSNSPLYLGYYYPGGGDESYVMITNYNCFDMCHITLSLVEKVEVYSEFALKSDINKLTTSIRKIPFERVNDTQFKIDKYRNGVRIVGKFVNKDETEETSFDFQFMEDVSSSTDKSRRSRIPGTSKSIEFRINSDHCIISVQFGVNAISSLTIDSLTIDESDEIVLKNDLNAYVKTTGDNTFDGTLTINSSDDTNDYKRFKILSPNTTEENGVGIMIGKQDSNNNAATFYYREPGTGNLGVHGSPFIISWSSSDVSINKPTMIIGNLSVSGTITGNSNTTITHYCPISSNNSINDFVIGAPVYMTGEVFKFDSLLNEFVKSTIDDTTDCISSVKTSGSWKEYMGICVRIDERSNCITFASLGDYMVKVDDSSCYSIGDEVFIDNEDNKLKILSGETAITSKIRRMTVGIITGIIDDKTLAVFR